ALDYSVWRNNFGASLPAGGGGLAATAEAAEALDLGELAAYSTPGLAAPSGRGATPIAVRQIGNSGSVAGDEFHNLLLASAKIADDAPNGEAADTALADFASTPNVDDKMLDALATDALEMPVLLP